MKTYIGTKQIEAEPQERDGKPGFKVRYQPDGYESWSPEAVFLEAYQPLDRLSFGHAIRLLKEGKRVARAGWTGKGMWLSLSGLDGRRLVKPEAFWSETNRAYAESLHGHMAWVLPCICMKTATGEILMGWLASQTDMLAEDWMLVE